MENKPAPLWDERADLAKELRLPNAPPVHVKNDQTKISSPNEETIIKLPTDGKVIKSRLSADAKEFVPSYLRNAPPPTRSSSISVQDRLKKHKIVTVDNQQESDSELLNESYFVDSPDDVRLKHLIENLTKDPGQFDDLLEIFMDTLCPYFEDVMVLSRAAQLLVMQAIQYPSFRYTAARLCCNIEQCCAEFRAALHLTCQKELKDNVNKSGLLLFVAELYTQLHHENIYGTYLIEAFKHLLETGGSENVKSVCQALKLTGSSLELYDKKSVDNVIEMLKNIKPTTSGTVLMLINSVIELKNSRWGVENTLSSPANSEIPFWSEPQILVFDNQDPNGLTLSTEENEFLAQHSISTDEFYCRDLSDSDDLYDPEPEMDEDIRKAFKDFVKLSKR